MTGITPEPALSSYDVGTVVTYRHAASGEYRTSTCTSEGTWTEVNFVQECKLFFNNSFLFSPALSVMHF